MRLNVAGMDTDHLPEDLLSVEDLAEAAGVSTKTVRRLLASGRLVADDRQRLGGQRFRYLFTRAQVAHVASLVHDSPAQSLSRSPGASRPAPRPRGPSRLAELDLTRTELARTRDDLDKARQDADRWSRTAQEALAALRQAQAENAELLLRALPPAPDPSPRRPWWRPWRR